MRPRYDHAVSFVWIRRWEEALDFYTNVLGFTRVYESEGWAELSIPGVEDGYLALNLWVLEETPPKNEFFTLRVGDLDRFKSYLESRNVHILGDVEEFVDEGQGLRMFRFADPERNVLTAAQIDV